MIPESLESAISLLKRNLTFNEKEFIKNSSENKILAQAHHSIGRDIRNDWGFWTDSNLKRELISLGLEHPDDMSGLILQCCIRDIKGEARDIPGIVKHYQEYWARMKVEYAPNAS